MVLTCSSFTHLLIIALIFAFIAVLAGTLDTEVRLQGMMVVLPVQRYCFSYYTVTSVLN